MQRCRCAALKALLGPLHACVTPVLLPAPRRLAADVWGKWSPEMQLGLWMVVREVTNASWEMLTIIREGLHDVNGAGDVHAGGFNPRYVNVNPPPTDLVEALRLCLLLENCISAQGDKLHRMCLRNIRIDASFPLVQPLAGSSACLSSAGGPRSSSVRFGGGEGGAGAGAGAGSSAGSPNSVSGAAGEDGARGAASPLQLRVAVGEFSGLDMPDYWSVSDMVVQVATVEVLRVGTERLQSARLGWERGPGPACACLAGGRGKDMTAPLGGRVCGRRQLLPGVAVSDPNLFLLACVVELRQMGHMEVRHTVQRRNDLLLGEVGVNLRQRMRVIQASAGLRGRPLPPYLAALLSPDTSKRPDAVGFGGAADPPAGAGSGSGSVRAIFGSSRPSPFVRAIVSGDEGVAVSLSQVTLTIPYRLELGIVADAVGNQVMALAGIISADTRCGWHPNNARHWRYFSRPSAPGFALRDGSQEPQAAAGGGSVAGCVAPVAPHVWLQCSEVKCCMMDDPWESWLGQVRVCATASSFLRVGLLTTALANITLAVASSAILTSLLFPSPSSLCAHRHLAEFRRSSR